MNTSKGSGMSNKAKIREEAKKLNPIDDLMFRTMAEDKAFCEEILPSKMSKREMNTTQTSGMFSNFSPGSVRLVVRIAPL